MSRAQRHKAATHKNPSARQKQIARSYEDAERHERHYPYDLATTKLPRFLCPRTRSNPDTADIDDEPDDTPNPD